MSEPSAREPGAEVLVVGAGPTGLALALQARASGARVRVVDKLPGPREWAPALAVQPRTLEVLRRLGVADELVEAGVSRARLVVHAGASVAEGTLSDLRLPHTRFPLILFAPQPAVEAVLRRHLAVHGVEVEWNKELIGLEQDGDGVRCRLSGRGGHRSVVSAGYLAGCDGAGSAVRRLAGIRFPGRSYRQRIVVGDVDPVESLGRGSAHAFLRGGGILFLFPLPSGRWRLIVPSPTGQEGEDIAVLVEAHTGGQVRLAGCEWLKVFPLEHRLADRYREGRVFLAGDSAHVHSPAGAQGMNTGIQDGVNLGWKLALAAQGAPGLLATYERERRRVAKHVMRLTGLAFALEVSQIPPLAVGRQLAGGPVASLLLSRPALMSAVARVVAGLDTRYRPHVPDPLACPRPGARLPDVRLGEVRRLHDLLEAPGFHLVAVGGRVPDRRLDQMAARGVTTHRVDPSDLSGVAGGVRLAAYVLVRPDGHVAASGRDEEMVAAFGYLHRWGIGVAHRVTAGIAG